MSDKMIRVTKESFYTTVGPLNVHPRAVKVNGEWISSWEVIPTREVIGETRSVPYAQRKTVGADNEYFVPEQFLKAHPSLVAVE